MRVLREDASADARLAGPEAVTWITVWTEDRLTRLRELYKLRDTSGAPLYDRATIAKMLGVGDNSLIARLGREFRAGNLAPRFPAPPRAKPKPKPVKMLPLELLVPNLVLPETRLSVYGHRELRSDYGGTGETRTPIAGRTLSSTPEMSEIGLIPNARTCQWPLWSHVERAPKPPRFCGAPIAGGSYCAKHYRIVWKRE